MHWYGEIPKTHGYVKKATCSTTRTTQPFYMNLYNICVCVTHKCIEWGWKDGGHTTVLANLEERCENGDEDERSSLELSLVWIFYHKNVFVTCVIFKRLLGAGNLLKTRSIKLIELLWHLTSSHPHPLLRAKKKKNKRQFLRQLLKISWDHLTGLSFSGLPSQLGGSHPVSWELLNFLLFQTASWTFLSFSVRLLLALVSTDDLTSCLKPPACKISVESTFTKLLVEMMEADRGFRVLLAVNNSSWFLAWLIYLRKREVLWIWICTRLHSRAVPARRILPTWCFSSLFLKSGCPLFLSLYFSSLLQVASAGTAQLEARIHFWDASLTWLAKCAANWELSQTCGPGASVPF